MRREYLKLNLATQQRDGKVIDGTGLERIIIPIPCLHEMVIRDPSDVSLVGGFVDRRRMQRHGLVVGDAAPAPALAGEKLRVEAPGGDGVDDGVVGAVCVVG